MPIIQETADVRRLPNNSANAPAGQNNQPAQVVRRCDFRQGWAQQSQVAQDDKVKPKLADEIKRTSEVNWNYALIERFNPMT